MRLRATALAGVAHRAMMAGLAPLLPLDALSAAAAYSTRRLRTAYTGPALRVRRSSDNAELNIGFATVEQTRTNLAPVPAASGDSRTVAGITLTVVGAGTEFGQSYVDLRWNGTATTNGNLQYGDTVLTSTPSTATQAMVTPGETYTCSMGYRVVAGTFPTFTAVRLSPTYRNNSSFVSSTNVNLTGLPNATLQRASATSIAPATANYVQSTLQMTGVTAGFTCDFTLRIYAPNTELGVGNARPLLQRYVAETIAGIGDLDAETLLAFDSSENRFVHSEDFTQTNWTNTEGTTVTSRTQLAPDGTTNASILTPTTANTFHRIAQTTTGGTIAGQAYTYSIFVKPNGYNFLLIRSSAFGAGLFGNAVFDLALGTVVFTSPQFTGASITPAPNGFYRVSITGVVPSTSNMMFLTRIQPTSQESDSISVFAGDGTSGYIAWGAQVNIGPVALPYTPTAATAQTLNINTGTFVPTWYDQSGNGRNATQSTAANQPNLVSIGAVNTQNGRPAPSFIGNLSLATAGFGTAAQRSVISVNTYSQATAAYQYVWEQGSSAGTTGNGFLVRTQTAFDWQAGDVFAFGNGFNAGRAPRFISNGRAASTALDIYSVSLGSAENIIRINGAAQASRVTVAGTWPASATAFGISRTNGAQGLSGQVAELVYIDDALSAGDRSALERNQGTYYGITVA